MSPVFFQIIGTVNSCRIVGCINKTRYFREHLKAAATATVVTTSVTSLRAASVYVSLVCKLPGAAASSASAGGLLTEVMD